MITVYCRCKVLLYGGRGGTALRELGERRRHGGGGDGDGEVGWGGAVAVARTRAAAPCSEGRGRRRRRRGGPLGFWRKDTTAASGPQDTLQPHNHPRNTSPHLISDSVSRYIPEWRCWRQVAGDTKDRCLGTPTRPTASQISLAIQARPQARAATAATAAARGLERK
eukprot:scaffold117209_cov59-Phaeocystis_antarctica.AAC.1